MNPKHICRLLLVATVVAAFLMAFVLASKANTPANSNNVFSLQAPSFVSVASAQGEPQAVASFFEDTNLHTCLPSPSQHPC